MTQEKQNDLFLRLTEARKQVEVSSSLCLLKISVVRVPENTVVRRRVRAVEHRRKGVNLHQPPQNLNFFRFISEIFQKRN